MMGALRQSRPEGCQNHVEASEALATSLPSFSTFIPLPKSNFNLNSISRWHLRLSTWRGDDGEEEKRMLVQCYSRLQSDPIRRQRHSARFSLLYFFIFFRRHMKRNVSRSLAFPNMKVTFDDGAYFLRLCAPYRSLAANGTRMLIDVDKDKDHDEHQMMAHRRATSRTYDKQYNNGMFYERGRATFSHCCLCVRHTWASLPFHSVL